MKILTILPVSRIKYLDRVLDSLIKQSYEERTALLVVVDGSNDLYVKVHNKLASLPLSEVLCVKSENVGDVAVTIPQRRQRIANIHNQIRGLVGEDVDWIFSIEDDGILPTNALSWLVNDIQSYPAVGLVTGVEVGRWGVPYVGAWTADDVFAPKEIISMSSKVMSEDVDEIDACGLYCALIQADLYKTHHFNADNGLGPDINMSLEFKQLGWKNYIDWFVPVTHLTEKGTETIEIPAATNTFQVRLTKLDDYTWHAGP